MTITLTKAAALAIQAGHIEWYADIYGNMVRPIVEAATTAGELEDGIEYDVVIINRHIPRGGAIEHLIGVHDDIGPRAVEFEEIKAPVDSGATAAQVEAPDKETFVYLPDRCPTNHWNRGDDICADCGTYLG